MKWTVGKKYLRSDGGFAVCVAVQPNGDALFRHGAQQVGHRQDGSVSCSPEYAVFNRPRNIVSDDSNTKQQPDGSLKPDLGDGDNMTIKRKPGGGGIENITINV